MQCGFAPGLEAALDEFMQNGELLKNFPQSAAPNSGRRALANLRIVATKGGSTFSKTWVLMQKQKHH
jgi:hypothetical protein